MTVSTSATTAGPFTPNGSTTTFPFTFVVMSADEVGVTIDGVEADPGDYSVTLNGDAPSDGSVTFTTAPATGAGDIYVYSDPSSLQEIDIITGGDFSADVVEQGFDRAAIRALANKRDAERGIRVPIGETLAPLPSAADRIGKVPMFDETTGETIEMLDPGAFVGVDGADGAPGANGVDGQDAENPNYTYVINTLAAGASATLAASGTYPDITLTFGIPRGDPGASGALSDGPLGDLTVSGGGTSVAINAGAVTYNKMQDVSATNRVLGRKTAGAGDVEELTASDLASLVSSVAGISFTTPSLTNPTATTQASSDNSTKVATTAFVKAQGYVTDAAALGSSATIEGEKIGFRDLPKSRTTTANFTLADSDRGKYIYHTGAAVTATIDPNGTTAIETDAIITIINNGTGSITISRGAGVALKLAGAGADANRTLAAGGIATLIKVDTNTWFISGAGVS